MSSVFVRVISEISLYTNIYFYVFVCLCLFTLFTQLHKQVHQSMRPTQVDLTQVSVRKTRRT
jgi:hypothetical protein